MLDVNGKVATWNVGAQRIKGYSAEEIIGRHFSVFYPRRCEGERMARLRAEGRRGKGQLRRQRLAPAQGWHASSGRTSPSRRFATTAGHLVGYAKLTRDLTESKRVEAVELASQQRDEILDAERSARMAAQRATRIKDEFLATLSHELRTPLSAILGWTQVLLRGGADDDPAQQRRAIEVIDRNARAQVQLIDDLLDLSRIMTGKIRLDLQQISLLDGRRGRGRFRQAGGRRQGHPPQGGPRSRSGPPSAPTLPVCSRSSGTC